MLQASMALQSVTETLVTIHAPTAAGMPSQSSRGALRPLRLQLFPLHCVLTLYLSQCTVVLFILSSSVLYWRRKETE